VLDDDKGISPRGDYRSRFAEVEPNPGRTGPETTPERPADRANIHKHGPPQRPFMDDCEPTVWRSGGFWDRKARFISLVRYRAVRFGAGSAVSNVRKRS
jgi:hypothetical protein